jgi:hypothetical protein
MFTGGVGFGVWGVGRDQERRSYALAARDQAKEGTKLASTGPSGAIIS